MTVSIPRQLLRPTGALVATILISTAAILYYVQYSIADLKQGLPLETVEHQRDLVITMRDLLALREAVAMTRAIPSAANFQNIPGRVRTLRENLEASHRHAEYAPLLGGMEISATVGALIRDVGLWLREGALGYPPNSPYVLKLIHTRVADTQLRISRHFTESNASAMDLMKRETAALERFGDSIAPAIIFVSLLALILVAYVLRQRRSEAAAQAAQQRLRDAIDSISGGLALFDSNERLVLCNPRYADLFPGAQDKVVPGGTFEEMLWTAARWGEILNVPADQVEDWVAKRLDRFRKPDKPLELALADGRWFRVSERRTADGGTVVISGEITESRRRERQLQGITEELRHKNVLVDAALDNMVQGLAMFDNEKQLIICNQRYLDIYDLPRELSQPGTPLKRIMEVSAELQSLLPDETEVLVERRLAIAEQPFEVRQQEFLSNGSVIDILHRPMPRGCSLATYEDATDRHKTEVALRAAKEEADLANRTKSEFLANMSHELRTPLNAIIGFSEIIKSELFGPIGFTQYGEYAGDIYDSGTHLLSLINDILDISKIEAGKFELQEECVDVNEAIVVSLRLIRERAEAAGIRIIQSVPQPLPSLNADLRALKQILLNLLSNAVKFTEAGGSVTVRASMDGEGRLVLTVGDTGMGMSEVEQCKALTPFGQVDSSLGRKHEGTGLGLPLCKRLVELHDGDLTLESEPGVGTTVSLLFPAHRVLSTRPSAEQASAS
jgi:signal transduction histidine kinase